jgi:hypothetical protein
MPFHDSVHVDLSILQGCLDAYGRVAAEHASDTTLAAAERLIRARLAVYACLTAAGWTPPTHVAIEERADRRLLRQRGGALAG